MRAAVDEGKGLLHAAYDKVTGSAQDAGHAAQEQVRQAYDQGAGAAQAGQEMAGQPKEALVSFLWRAG